jgi:UDPglucose 6-dehydrogenase
MNKLGVIGVGRLGICTALALEKAGYTVYCLDKNTAVLDAIEQKTYQSIEPMVTSGVMAAKHLVTVQHIEKVYALPVNFVVVATPSLGNGSYDHSAVDEVVDGLIAANQKHVTYYKKLLIISCTTMPTYCDTIQKRLAPYNYSVLYNPEFIAQGDIMRGLKNPDMVLIGHNDVDACNTLKQIYRNFLENSPPFQCMSRTEAEITKIALNCFLTTKIAFANSIGDIVLKAGGDPNTVLNAIGSDTRVGNKYLKWGHGFGGPCLPRDNRALNFFAESIGQHNRIGEVTDMSNKKHLDALVQYVMDKNTRGLPVLFTSIVYKKGTHILEESQKLALALKLVEHGVNVCIHDDAKILAELKKSYGDAFAFCDALPDEYASVYFDVNAYIL